MQTATNYNFLIVLIVTFGSLTYGYNSAIIGAVIGLPSFFEYFNIDIKSESGSRITGGESRTKDQGQVLTSATSDQWALCGRRLYRLLPYHLARGQGGKEEIDSDHLVYLHCRWGIAGGLRPYRYVPGRSIHDGSGCRHGQRHYTAVPV